jgi:dihydropteroate synthase
MTRATAERTGWRTARGTIAVDRPAIAGVLNVTPDSFWSGGRHDTVDAAVRHTATLLEEGADLIDVGGESTRPGASPVDARRELERIIPVIREIARQWPDVPVSVDTVKSDVARAAIDAGAWIVNDVSAFRIDPAIAHVAAASGAGAILMHSRGAVADMAHYKLARYGDDPVGEIIAELRQSIDAAIVAGVPSKSIVIDPGLGFAKRTEHSVAVLAQLERFTTLGFPVLVGPSRKRFIGEISGGAPPEQRLEGTIAACLAAFDRGARLFRVHDVRAVRRALDVALAIHTGTAS